MSSYTLVGLEEPQPLELELLLQEVVSCLMWMLGTELLPLEEQKALTTTEPSIPPPFPWLIHFHEVKNYKTLKNKTEQQIAFHLP